jgi:hypothetical protein
MLGDNMKEDDIKREIDRMIDYRKPNYPHDDGPLSDAQVYQIRKLNMNDKIKLLAEQAGYSKDYLEIGLPSNMEKFAELIVLECADIADTAEPYKSSDLIKKHFGVE